LRGERRVLTVIVGTDSEATRAEESLKLLNWSFQNFDTVKLFDKGQAALTAPVWEGQTKIAELGPPTPIWLSIPRGKAGDIKPIAERTDPLVAPLEQGQRIGTLRLTLNDKTLRIEPLVVQTAVERAGFFKRMIDLAKRQL
jgi:D-alanyl-D-alanine carboxypeptidase (penicillin-binding protein 5/6)